MHELRLPRCPRAGGISNPAQEINAMAGDPCLEYARDVLPLVEGQVAAGMRPFIVTPQGAGTAELYLSGSRQEQPERFLSSAPGRTCATGAISARSRSGDNFRYCARTLFHGGHGRRTQLFLRGLRLSACIEEMAVAAELCEPGSWMGRSFRVAEQFVLSRAAAAVSPFPGNERGRIGAGRATGKHFRDSRSH